MHNRNRRTYLFVLLVASAMVVAFSGCSGKGKASDESKKQLVIAIPEEIEGSDLDQINWENIVHALMYEPLVSYDLKMKNLLPSAAESYSVSEDGKTITFKIASDATFANGDPLTAKDVAASFQRYKDISPYSSDLDPVQEIQTPDEKTLILKLDAPSPFLWPVLASTYGGVVDTKKAEEIGKEEFNRKGVGNGAFLLQEWTQGSQVSFIKNPKYKTSYTEVTNKGPSAFDSLIVRFIPDNFTRISELEAGTVDIAMNVPVESLDDLRKNDKMQLFSYLQVGIDYIFLNVENPILSDLRVRQALSYAVNRDELKTALKDTVDPRYGLLSPAQICYDAELESSLKAQYGYNIDKAKALLAEAGYKDSDGDGVVEKNGKPLSLTLMVALDSPYLKQSAPVIQAQLKNIGVDLQLREYEVKYIKQMITEHNYEMATRYYWWTDPDILYYVFHKDAEFVWSNPVSDKLIMEGRTILDPKARTAKYSEVQKTILADMPVITLYSEYQYIAAGKNVKNIKVSVDGTMHINDVVKE